MFQLEQAIIRAVTRTVKWKKKNKNCKQV